MWEVQSPNNAGTNTWPNFRRRLRQTIAYDQTKALELFTTLVLEVEAESRARLSKSG